MTEEEMDQISTLLMLGGIFGLCLAERPEDAPPYLNAMAVGAFTSLLAVSGRRA